MNTKEESFLRLLGFFHYSFGEYTILALLLPYYNASYVLLRIHIINLFTCEFEPIFTDFLFVPFVSLSLFSHCHTFPLFSSCFLVRSGCIKRKNADMRMCIGSKKVEESFVSGRFPACLSHPLFQSIQKKYPKTSQQRITCSTEQREVFANSSKTWIITS